MDTPTSPGSSTTAAADTARQAVHDLTDKAKEQASGLADKAKETASEHLSDGKEKATGVLSDAAEALHSVGDTLRDNDQDAFARYADMAAGQVQQFTDAIRGRSVGELLDEAEDFARREPALFLGGAFLLGIFGARFLKAAGMTGGDLMGGSGQMGGQSGGRSARGLLSSMTVPGGPSNQHVANVNRPPAGAYGADLSQGHSGSTGGTSMGGQMGGGGSMSGGTGGQMGARPGGLSGGNLPANSPAAAGGSSMGTAVGTRPSGADAPVRSGPGASPMSTSPGGGSPGTGTGNPGAQGTATPPSRPAQDQDDKGTEDAARH
jgi:uncharacterized protein YjbJ (UPF0337 family)